MPNWLYRGVNCLLIGTLGAGLLASPPAQAFVEVKQHVMRCSATFPCPRELQNRVNFWIDVYSRWDSQDAVLHDALTPHRVYKVIEGRACGRKGNTPFIKNQKKRIAGELHNLARQLERRYPVKSAYGKHLLKLFPERSSAELRRAAGNIRCQSGNRDGFQAALRRFGTYGPLVRRVLKDARLPADIQYLPFVESSYNPKAYSRVGAAGLWQIMPATGRTLGLELNATVDERLDPEAASWAAARYLKEARKTLTVAALAKNTRVSDSAISPFVITSYNYGVNGMRRAIKKLGPDYIRVLNQHRSSKFQIAVKNFYSGFLAARHVARNAKRFFGDIKPGRPLTYRTLILKRSVSIARIQNVFGLTEAQLKSLNPALTRFVWHGWRFIPHGYRLRLPPRTGGWANQVARLRMMPSETRQTGALEYTVRKGDTACGIAAAFQTECTELIALNGLGNKALIRVGQKLQVPPTGRARSTVAQRGAYVVRPGDSVCAVARRFGTDCDDLLAANDLHRGSVLAVGSKLVIPGTLKRPPGGRYTVGKGDSVCSIASRHGIGCDLLLTANGLAKGDLIFPGQTLTIPGAPGSVAAPVKKPAAPAVPRTSIRYTVVPGDSACRIAARFEVSCRQLISDNALGTDAVIRPGQILQLAGVPTVLARAVAAAVPKPSVKLPAAPATATLDQGTGDSGGSQIADKKTPAPEALATTKISPLDQPIDLSIQTAGVNGETVYRINIEPEETLGHYSDWLRLGGVKKLRDLNGYDTTRVLATGDALLLPVSGPDKQHAFERRRQEYHRVLVEEFKENFDVTGTTAYTVEAGDSLWVLAREFELPIWVITRFNPALRTTPPRAGEILKIPRIRSRKG
ncbi:MAG: LysM peptidoglycan-binding domain-containing protein [Proteobacteria bacterium]|nr:LysM peptidoglycan-binding domain-containing protein [Pseudomonadota bacterium]